MDINTHIYKSGHNRVHESCSQETAHMSVNNEVDK